MGLRQSFRGRGRLHDVGRTFVAADDQGAPGSADTVDTVSAQWLALMKGAFFGLAILCIAIVGIVMWRSILDDYRASIVRDTVAALRASNHAP